MRTIDSVRLDVNTAQESTFTLADLARRWQCSMATVRRRVSSGRIKAFVPPGTNKLHVSPLDVQEAEESSAKSTRPAARFF